MQCSVSTVPCVGLNVVTVIKDECTVCAVKDGNTEHVIVNLELTHFHCLLQHLYITLSSVLVVSTVHVTGLQIKSMYVCENIVIF